MIVDPNTDIVRPLTRIADSMSVPHSSPWLEWLKVLVSFIAGICTAYISDFLRNRSNESKEQLRLRRIVYYELAQCFFNIDLMVTGPAASSRTRFTVMRDLSPFDGENYMKQNPAVSYSLPEGEILSSLYNCFGAVCRVGPEKKVFGMVQMKSPLGYFSECYRNNSVIKKNFKKVLSPQEFKALDSRVKNYKWAFTFEELADSGIVEIVDESKK